MVQVDVERVIQIHRVHLSFIATFRVARLTLQTRKLWLVGVATDRDAPLACPNVKTFFSKKQKKEKKRKQKKKQEKT